MTKYGMAIDVGGCSGCRTCVVSCQLFNAQKPGVSWIKVTELEQGLWPNAERAYLPQACMHCEDPLCVTVCPTTASFQREDNTVGIDHERCIGCGVCKVACAYGARTIDTDAAWYFDSDFPAPYEEDKNDRRGTAEKCTFCYERIKEGKDPICVESCINRIRVFGDLDDPDSPLYSYIEEIGAQNIPGTSLYYAPGKQSFNLIDAVMESYKEKLSKEPKYETKSVFEGNAAVLAISGAAIAATTAGLFGVKKSQNKQRDDSKSLQGETDF